MRGAIMISQNLTETSRYLFHEGTHYDAYQFMGAHLCDEGVRFTTWAKNATSISVVGDFNNWDTLANPMQKIDNEGLWSVTVANAKPGDAYKYYIINYNAYRSEYGHEGFYKSDPYAFYSKIRPETDSVVYAWEDYEWNDKEWIEQRDSCNILEQPISIYEVHLASWKKTEDGHWYNYEELADRLIPYLHENNFTHIELMPIMEHPYDGSWGYQITGYYSITSRFGTPDQFKRFVDRMHQAGFGVILDWVPNHYCKDLHGLMYFDGEALYESTDPILRENLEWGTMNFDYNVPEVNSFLISCANFYMENFHIDGFRVDAVAFMLHKHMRTGRYDIFNERDFDESSINFIKRLNTEVFRRNPNMLMIAEESSAFPMVTWPVADGGLGFNLKWNMGWMHDTLKYMKTDPIGRKHNHDKLTFSIFYAFNENFMLPLSHDEVVHCKKSLIEKMPGDYWQQFANMRTLMSYQYFHPGKKLNFMGNEFAQFVEWNEWHELDWFLLEYESHLKFNDCFKELNRLYKAHKPLHEVDFQYNGFDWLVLDRVEDSVIAFRRIAKDGSEVIAVINFTPVVRRNYPIPIKTVKKYELLFNSDDYKFGGSGVHIPRFLDPIDLNARGNEEAQSTENANFNLIFDLPPLSAVLFKPE